MLIVAFAARGPGPSFAVGGELGRTGTNAHHGGSLPSWPRPTRATARCSVHAGCRHRHQHRGRPSGLLRQHQAYTGCSTDSWTASRRVALVGNADDPGAASLAKPARTPRVCGCWRRRPGGRGALPLAAAGALAAAGHRRGCRDPAGGRGPTAGDAVVGARSAHGPQCAGRVAGGGGGGRPGRRDPGRAGRFRGVRRRFELVGVANRCGSSTTTRIIRPRSARRSGPCGRSPNRAAGRTLAVFQPHLYSRTKAFAAEFGSALDATDRVFVLDVYAARAADRRRQQGDRRHHVGTQVSYEPDVSAVAAGSPRWRSPVMVVTMGAGDVTMLGPQILTEIRRRPTGTFGRRH